MKKNYSKFLAQVGASMLLLVLLGGCTLFNGNTSAPKLEISTQKGKVTYVVEIADTYETRKNGLMFRTSLAEKHGMLFVFDQSQVLTFWMKNTLIPLDMIFMDRSYKVVHIEKNLPPCKTEQCPLYYSGTDAQYVLEANGGEADKLGIKEGDQATVTK